MEYFTNPERRIRRFPKVFSQEQIDKIIKTMEESELYLHTPTGTILRWRDATAILLSYYCCLRPGETTQLRWNDLDWEKSEVHIAPSFNKERNNMSAPFPEKAKELIKKYQEVLEHYHFKSDYLFPSLWTQLPITESALSKKFNQILKKAGLYEIDHINKGGQEQSVYRLYTLRHTFCTETYKKTHSEEAVTQLARHIRPESAHTYIHLSTEDKKKIADSVLDDGI